jgi:hypothetical protein
LKIRPWYTSKWEQIWPFLPSHFVLPSKYLNNLLMDGHKLDMSSIIIVPGTRLNWQLWHVVRLWKKSKLVALVRFIISLSPNILWNHHGYNSIVISNLFLKSIKILPKNIIKQENSRIYFRSWLDKTFSGFNWTKWIFRGFIWIKICCNWRK